MTILNGMVEIFLVTATLIWRVKTASTVQLQTRAKTADTPSFCLLEFLQEMHGCSFTKPPPLRHQETKMKLLSPQFTAAYQEALSM